MNDMNDMEKGQSGENTAMPVRKRLVVIGGGFGGVNLAKHIDKKLWDVVVVDRNNYHSFPPLFYQVASAGLEPASISFPLRREFRRRKLRGCRFHNGEVKVIDPERKMIVTPYEELPYDKLVIASGTTNNFFGMTDLVHRVYTIKSTEEAVRCRNRVLTCMERACVAHDPERRRRLLTFVIIGGGPAGVEIAGALGELKRYVVPREYKSFRQEDVKVILVEGSDALLRAMGPKSGRDALSALNKLMVDVKLGAQMQSYDDKGMLTLSDGTRIEADTLIWTAGITGTSFEVKGEKPLPFTRGHRISVDEYNRVEGFDDIYAIGDMACHCDERFPAGVPQLAQGAIQQGRTLAFNLNAMLKGKPMTPFSYRDKGTMATIGRNHAVVDLGKVHFKGWFAWMAWMFIHLITLMGMRNRMVVLLNWIYSYFTFSSGLRLILRASRMPDRPVTDCPHDDLDELKPGDNPDDPEKPRGKQTAKSNPQPDNAK